MSRPFPSGLTILQMPLSDAAVAAAPSSDTSDDELIVVIDPSAPQGSRVRQMPLSLLKEALDGRYASTGEVDTLQEIITPQGGTPTAGAATTSLTLVPQSSPPTNPAAGTIYLDSSTGQLKVYNGTAFVPVTGSSPVGPSSITLSNSSVLEQSAQGFVVGNLSADQVGCTFSIVGGDTSYFQISGAQLQCSATPLFYSAATSRSVTIRATNTVGLTVDKSFTIAVTQIVTTPNGGTPVQGTPDVVPSSAPYVTFALPTSSNTGYRGTLQPYTNITTNQSAAVYRSGNLIYLAGTNPILEGYDCSGAEVYPKSANWIIRDCLFDCETGSTHVVWITQEATAAVNGTLTHNTCNGKKQANNTNNSFFGVWPSIMTKEVSWNKTYDMPTDVYAAAGPIKRAVFNYATGGGFQAGAHPDIFTFSGGYANQEESIVAYNVLDHTDAAGVVSVGGNSTVKIADGTTQLRSNFFIYRNLHKGCTYQHQINLSEASGMEFSENVRYLKSGPPVYDSTAPVNEGWRTGPYGAFFSEVYSSDAIMIHDEVEARDGTAAVEPGTTQALVRSITGRPGQVVINSIGTNGAFSIQAVSGATSYQYRTSIAGTADFNAWQTVTTSGTTTLTGTITLIPNAYNHVLFRAVNASGPGWVSKTKEVAVAAVGATPTAPAFTVAASISGTATQGQTLTCSPGTVTGSPTPTITYQWQRDVAGNATYSNISSATSQTYTLVSADAGNKVRCVVTAANGVGSNATSNTSPTALVAAASSTITYGSIGTASVSALGDSSGTSTATAGAPASVAAGDLLLRFVQWSSATGLTTPTNWTLLASEEFFGSVGGAVFYRAANGTGSDTPAAITVSDSRSGDYLSDVVIRYTGGSAGVEGAVTDRTSGYTSTTFTPSNLTATGANRRLITAFFHECDNTGTAVSVTGTAPTGHTERFEANQTGGYKQTVSIQEKDALVGVAGTNTVVTPGTRTFTAGPQQLVAISFLIY